jgi:Ca2+-binding EF-hand superfamily protein
MNMLDLDRDGKITLREFKDCIQKSFQNANIFV